MSEKTRKLARDMMKLLSSASEEEVQEAFVLLESGQLFGPTLDRAKKLPRINAGIKPPKAKKDLTKDLIETSNSPDRGDIREFALGVEKRRYLRSTRLLRSFCKDLHIDVPDKLPSRPVIALKIIENIISLPESRRRNIMEIGRRIDEEGISSLEGWSNLIVK